MAVYCEFIDFIIPIAKIDSVYPGGFAKFKKDNLVNFSGRMWHDEFLFRDGAMNPLDIESLIENWEKLGLKATIDIDGQKQWLDFCVVEGMFGGTTLPCQWLEYDSIDNCVYLKEKPKGLIVGPNRE